MMNLIRKLNPTVRSLLAGGLALAMLSAVSVQTGPQRRDEALATGAAGAVTRQEVVGDTPLDAVPGDPAAAAPAAGATAGGAVSGAASGPAASASGGLECRAGRNGGSTDRGVTANTIKLASTHVLSGPGSSFLGSSHVGMEAVVANVNSQGGICGRLLDLTLRDDEWRADRGSEFIRNFIESDYFALPVVPSSEGLTQAIRSRYIANARIPVIGTDGMLKEQYEDPNVWPVATATVSTMRSMAKYAYETLGVRQFGIVYDNQYKFGREGARAFRDFVEKRLAGARVDAFIGIQPGQPSYPEAESFSDKCGSGRRCEFVAMLLEPGTASSWINSHGNDGSGRRLGFGAKGTGGAQPLFNESFARACGEPCSGMLLWTGYNPPIGELKNLPGVAKYVNDVRAISPGVDVSNQFLEGSYLGMQLFVDALKKVGPNLTRDRLRQAMDSMTFTSDLASPLVYAPGRHCANLGAQAFAVVTAAGGFAGFRDVKTGFVRDPDPCNFPKD